MLRFGLLLNVHVLSLWWQNYTTLLVAWLCSDHTSVTRSLFWQSFVVRPNFIPAGQECLKVATVLQLIISHFKPLCEGKNSLPLTRPSTHTFVLVLLSSKHTHQTACMVYTSSDLGCATISDARFLAAVSMRESLCIFKFPITIFQFTVGIKAISTHTIITCKWETGNAGWTVKM